MLQSRHFGNLATGEAVEAFTLKSQSGGAVEVITLGCIITSLRVPDRAGQFADVVLGFNDFADYLAPHPHFGAVAGRVAGRITGACFHLDGRMYSLAPNDAPNHLHGGRVGFDRRVWRATPVARDDGADSLRLSYHSLDGEEGYPGTLDVSVTYTLTAENALIVETWAVTDKATPFSLTQHSYFNLAGEGSGSIVDHEIQIHASDYAAVNDGMGLLGRCEVVTGRGNDFTRSRRVGDALPHLFQQHGDLYFLRRNGHENSARTLRSVARVFEPGSGRILTVSTDEDCLQFYTGVALDGTLTGKSGRRYGPHAGFCLECEGYPDGANVPVLGDIILRPGQTFRRTTIYAFSTE